MNFCCMIEPPGDLYYRLQTADGEIPIQQSLRSVATRGRGGGGGKGRACHTLELYELPGSHSHRQPPTAPISSSSSTVPVTWYFGTWYSTDGTGTDGTGTAGSQEPGGLPIWSQSHYSTHIIPVLILPTEPQRGVKTKKMPLTILVLYLYLPLAL